jgi:hypothetical protein
MTARTFSGVRLFALAALVLSIALAAAAPRPAEAAPPPHTDILFVFDTSGSMEGALTEAGEEIQEAMSQIDLQLPDVQYGLSEVKDVGGSVYDEEEPYDLPWELDERITSDRQAISDGIDGLWAGGGGDRPEAYGRALWEADTNPAVGWRSGARHLIVLVADNVPHDDDLDAGIPPEFWVEDAPWETGEELPEPAGVSETRVNGSTNLDWQSVLAQIAADGKPLEFVDFHGDGSYLPYWENWTGRTGGRAVLASTGELASQLVSLAVSGAGTVPDPPAPAAPASSRPCALVKGSVGKQLRASVKCTAALTKYEVKCGVELSLGKAVKGLKTAKGLFVLSKVPKKTRPLAKLINHIKTAKFKKSAPPGFRSPREVIARLDEAHDAKALVFLVVDLSRALSWEDFKQIALDVGDVAGAKACVEGLITAVE